MLIQGAISSEKTNMLVQKYAELLNSGISSLKILVLLQNSSKKDGFIKETLENLNINSLEKFQVYSFYGLVYNTISDNWAFLENSIKDSNTKILPNLVGLEVSQSILKNIIKDVKFEGYNSKKSLLHQLFRRYSLIVQNNLNDNDVKWRSQAVLKESFAPDAKKALDEFKKRTLELRSFDYLRQSLIFNHLYKNTDYFSKIEYLLIDDGDEITPICFDFVKFLKPQLKDIFIAYDPMGSSRWGYLSADKRAVFDFEKMSNEAPLSLPAKTALKDDAQTIFDNITKEKSEQLRNFSLFSTSKRARMFDEGIKKIKKLINSGINPCEIAVITPIIDDMLKFLFRENLPKNQINPVFLSGSEKIIQNPLVSYCITILKLCDETLREELSEFEIRPVLSDFLKIPIKYCREILEEFEKTKRFIGFNFKNSDFSKNYSNFLVMLERLKKINKLSEQIYEISELIEFKFYEKNEINKFNFFVKQIEDFESVFSGKNIKNSEIINQIENSVISENPYSTLEIKENDLVIATPQKIIDNQIQTKYQLWFDISSDEWMKSDTGPLYNAWVFQAGWDKPEFTLQDNIELSKQKTARILRKLTLCAGDKIYAYASLFNSMGIENFGGIESRINTRSGINEDKWKEFDTGQEQEAKVKKIIPRDDQKPVLDYKTGSMAISAVPGAGKTTILLLLILKLLDEGVNPENIFVLTYMESAARNFRERIQLANPYSIQLPNISTIHGLALKILKENSNFEKLGLNPDFEICDDSRRTRILREISTKLKLKKTESEDFDKAASVLKINCAYTLTPNPSLLRGEGLGVRVNLSDKNLSKFLEFFNEYDLILKENNLIDYDDMLLLSVKLLKDNPDILKYYQDICRYIIEDEAQDSSQIQQELISLLSSKHKNLIRCGDVNQAITTTFSNADVEGFRNFIEQAQTTVGMNRSQRCTKAIWEFANNLLKFSQKNPKTKNAFYEIFMQPVEGKNPQEKNAVVPIVFDNEFAEKNFILKQIKTILSKTPDATLGILLRKNYQVTNWTKFIGNSGLKAITRSECLEQKVIFRTIFAIFKIIQNPFDNDNLACNYDILAEAGHYKSGMFAQIRNFPLTFIQTSADNIKNLDLVDFYWDMNYWLNFSSMPIEELAVKIGLYYYPCNQIEKSNVYLIATLIKRLNVQYKKFSVILDRLSELAKKPNLSGFKFFSEEDENDKKFFAGKVQIMTIHKAKGDEFDFVFLPELSEENLPIEFENMPLKKNLRFMENVKELNPNYKNKTDDDLKEFLLAENLRLLYVAITRAKRKLFFSVSKISKPYGKEKAQKPSVIFKQLLKSGNSEAANE